MTAWTKTKLCTAPDSKYKKITQFSNLKNYIYDLWIGDEGSYSIQT